MAQRGQELPLGAKARAQLVGRDSARSTLSAARRFEPPSRARTEVHRAHAAAAQLALERVGSDAGRDGCVRGLAAVLEQTRELRPSGRLQERLVGLGELEQPPQLAAELAALLLDALDEARALSGRSSLACR